MSPYSQGGQRVGWLRVIYATNIALGRTADIRQRRVSYVIIYDPCNGPASRYESWSAIGPKDTTRLCGLHPATRPETESDPIRRRRRRCETPIDCCFRRRRVAFWVSSKR